MGEATGWTKEDELRSHPPLVPRKIREAARSLRVSWKRRQELEARQSALDLQTPFFSTTTMSNNDKMDVDEQAIDEGLYSRQLCVPIMPRYALLILKPATSLATKVCIPPILRLLDNLTLTLAMKRMAASNVLIVGLKGLGAEIGRVKSPWVSSLHSFTSSQEYRPGRCQVCCALRS